MYIPLLTERDISIGQGYKHLAPPEQGTSIKQCIYRRLNPQTKPASGGGRSANKDRPRASLRE